MTETAQNDQSAEKTTPAQKPRSPVERMVVWGLILILLGVAGFEGQAKWGYTSALASLQEGIAASEKGPNTNEYQAAEFEKTLKGMFSKSDPETQGKLSTVSYQWNSLIHEYRIDVTMTTKTEKEESIVLNFETPNAEAEPAPPLVDSGDTEGADEMAMGEPMGLGGPDEGHAGPGESNGPGGPGGGGQRRLRGIQKQLADQTVQAEIGLTDGQATKIEEFFSSQERPDFAIIQGLSPEERTAFFDERRQKTEAGIKAILDEKQFARVRQLTLQDTGLSAVGQSDIQADLRITDAQKEKLTPLLQEYGTSRRELGRDASPEERQQFNAEWNSKIASVLTAEQKSNWEKLAGSPVNEGATSVAKEESPSTEPKEAAKPESKEKQAENSEEKAKTAAKDN